MRIIKIEVEGDCITKDQVEEDDSSRFITEEDTFEWKKEGMSERK